MKAQEGLFETLHEIKGDVTLCDREKEFISWCDFAKANYCIDPWKYFSLSFRAHEKKLSIVVK